MPVFFFFFFLVRLALSFFGRVVVCVCCVHYVCVSFRPFGGRGLHYTTGGGQW